MVCPHALPRLRRFLSPAQGHVPPPYPPSRRPPPDPHTFDYPASLKQYAEWFRYFYPQQATEEDSADKAAEQEANDGSKPRNGIKARWEKYKKEFAANQVSIASLLPLHVHVFVPRIHVAEPSPFPVRRLATRSFS
ncbi:hypothetical protein NMY22_g10963 [Coprinellus aureogranulatus]|nr:hypothetical protein NMY22_g10963 [Coprinellus aureogranulatus]